MVCHTGIFRCGAMAIVLLIAGCSAPPPVAAPTTGTIRGVVKYAGPKPEPRRLSVATDPYCAKCWELEGKTGPLSERWIWGDNETLVNVLVWISDGLGDRVFEVPKEQVTLELSACRFEPHVLAVRVGQPFFLTSADGTLHAPVNVSLIEPMVVPPLPVPDSLLFRFSKEEIGKDFQCQAHAWERAYVHVLAHPYYDITRQAGTFEIRDVPLGEYELSAWHELRVFIADQPKMRVIVEAGKVSEVIFTYRPRERG
ncbi:MAG: hypothetical protein WD768_07365 [Phycisphaeraceae bacterium]